MSMAYLVEGHLGGLYVSTSSPASITAYCDQCGDSDWIAASWMEGDMEAEAKEIAAYFVNEWNQNPEAPWEMLRYWSECGPKGSEENQNDALEALADFDGFSSDAARERALAYARELWTPVDSCLEAWGIEPFDRERLLAALADSARYWFGAKALTLDAESLFKQEQRTRLGIRRTWESDFPDGEEILVSAIDGMFEGYKELYEQHYGISL